VNGGKFDANGIDEKLPLLCCLISVVIFPPDTNTGPGSVCGAKKGALSFFPS